MQVCTSLQSDNHPTTTQFLQARSPSWRPTNSVKALKAQATVHSSNSTVANSTSELIVFVHLKSSLTYLLALLTNRGEWHSPGSSVLLPCWRGAAPANSAQNDSCISPCPCGTARQRRGELCSPRSVAADDPTAVHDTDKHIHTGDQKIPNRKSMGDMLLHYWQQLSTATHRPSWRVGYSDCTQLMMLPLNGWKHETTTSTFDGPLSRTTQVSRYQKGKTNLDFTEARDSEWHWHQLGHMQVCISLQTDNHASTHHSVFFTGGCPSCCPTNSVKALKTYGS